MQRLEVSGAVQLIYRSLGVKGLNSVLFDGRVCLSKMTEGPVCDASAAATVNAEIKNTWITPPLPPFLCSILRNSAMRQVKFYFAFRSEKCVLRRLHKLKVIILYS